MSKKKIIAIDIDDVIVETTPLVLEHYNEKYGTKLELKDAYSNNTKLWGTDRETAIARVEAFLVTDEYGSVPPLEETIKAIRQLAEHHELHIVTGRSTIIETATKDMLNRYFPDIFRSVTFTNMFTNKVRSKVGVCQELGTDVLIDDHLRHALSVAECGITVLLFGSYPWNQADELPANVRRTKDWAAVLQYFDEQS